MKITVLSDEKSWINEYIDLFLKYLALNNHEYRSPWPSFFKPNSQKYVLKISLDED